MLNPGSQNFRAILMGRTGRNQNTNVQPRLRGAGLRAGKAGLSHAADSGASRASSHVLSSGLNTHGVKNARHRNEPGSPPARAQLRSSGASSVGCAGHELKALEPLPTRRPGAGSRADAHYTASQATLSWKEPTPAGPQLCNSTAQAALRYARVYYAWAPKPSQPSSLTRRNRFS